MSIEDQFIANIRPECAFGLMRIFEERVRQIQQEGYAPAHDDKHEDESIALAAACYACPDHLDFSVVDGEQGEDAFPWPDGDKRATHTRKRRLAIAGALIAAELDRLDRAAAAQPRDHGADGGGE